MYLVLDVCMNLCYMVLGIPVAGGVSALLPTSVADFGRWTVQMMGEEVGGESGRQGS